MEKLQNFFASLTGQEKVGLIDPSLPSLYSKAPARPLLGLLSSGCS